MKRTKESEKLRNKLRYQKDPKNWYAIREKSNRNWLLLKKFGITIDDYEKMNLKQKGKCAICGNAEDSKYRGKLKRLAVDHCHKTGKIRELLCTRCNTCLGVVSDKIGLLMKAIKYLNKHKGRI